ncbi:hypothetical protein A5668_00220 [Mycolicibacterium fortuitum]|uniref:helix-turn-helix domain-containing protein n=1 Tax=Mycolicibacterium fortuitum TaxID=1766 RepID=UPI0007E930A0|nr:helix-turn-helix transcriptional regulator [Mycolicibacterium fortuitum]OBA97163.1 hypothetical protein A5668_00220 [Mycolicibacterium fortuitum]UBV22122.1 helix-turn-helix transcriptional regulator [Mycolicibacterium fortuitum]
MAGKKIELGHSGRTVAANVKRLRGSAGLTYTQLAEKLENDRGISPLAVRRIEDGTRRVDADDLVAIAVALGVSPATLLMPHTNIEGTKTGLDDLVNPPTGVDEPLSALRLWKWLGVEEPLPGDADVLGFLSRARPHWVPLSRRDLQVLLPGESDGPDGYDQ